MAIDPPEQRAWTIRVTNREAQPASPLPEAPQLPLCVLVLAEFTARDGQTGSSPVRPRRIRIDKSNFHEVVEQLAGRVVLEVPNRLTGMPQTLWVEIPLKDLKSFRPEAIAEQVPGLKDLLTLREVITQARARKLSRQDLQQRLCQSPLGAELFKRLDTPPSASTATPAPVPPSGAPSMPPSVGKSPRGEKEEALEALSELVESPQTPDRSSPQAAEPLLNQLLSAIARPAQAGEAVDRRAADAVIADLDAILTAQVDEILHHAEFRRLESTWSGLKFLVDRTDFRENIQLEVISAAKTSLLDVLNQEVFEREREGSSDVFPSVIIADYEFDHSHDDIDLLRELSQQVGLLQIPLISSIGAAFLGLDSADAVVRLPYLGEYFGRPEYIKWNAFRQMEASRWVSLVFNRFLLRLPYGPDGGQVRAWEFRESISRGADSYIWGNPVWALASLLAASFAKSGWPTEISGIRGGGVVENLPVRTYGGRGVDTVTMPLEVLTSEQMSVDLADNGIIALTCRGNSDAAIMLSAPTTHRPERYADAAVSADSALRATLPYQLLASRIAHHLKHLLRTIVPGNTADGIREDLAQALRQYLSTSGESVGEAVRVDITESKERPGDLDVIIHVRPGRQVLGGRAAVELRVQIPH